MPVATDVFGSAIDSISISLANQSSAFSSARMTSRSRYTFSIQALFDVVSRFGVRLFVESFKLFFANDEPSAVSQRLRPRPEDAVLDEPVQTFDEFRREGDRNRLSVTAHTPT
jgi:hypothetical protein